ncbi:HNH endonuclease [Botrimarina sp.]|uniref:HNH endonuclease n=1 Tax=Botrimarina sp. TaxID=2795802 RepID=UPI0032EDB6A4
MATAPLRRCGRCRRLSRGKCEACHRTQRRSYDRTRPSDPFYCSRAWRKLRAAFLAEHPLCRDCLSAGRTTAAAEVHHREKRADRPDLALTWGNLEALCKGCHSRRTNRGE